MKQDYVMIKLWISNAMIKFDVINIITSIFNEYEIYLIQFDYLLINCNL